jgi:hypothetical protein
VDSSELGSIYRRTGHPSSCRPRHTDRLAGRRSYLTGLTIPSEGAGGKWKGEIFMILWPSVIGKREK